MDARLSITTAPAPGAIGIIQLHGPDVHRVLESLTGKPVETARCRVADLGGIDEGVVAMLREDWAQVMPHGGPRVIQRLCERLVELGAAPSAEAGLRQTDVSARDRYPEAADEIEALMLATMAIAASPAAIDLLLDQPEIWRRWLAEHGCHGLDAFSNPCSTVNDHTGWEKHPTRGTPVPPLAYETDPRRHLIEPPSVVLVGRANVGKSTLTNLVLGRAASITADLPGTTRDWVAGLAELPTPIGELAVRWFDTPGLRDTSDAIEQQAIALAANVIRSADVLVAIRDPQTDWPSLADARQPDLWVMNKADTLTDRGTGEGTRDVPLHISALHGEGLESLGRAVAERLGITMIPRDKPWVFWREVWL